MPISRRSLLYAAGLGLAGFGARRPAYAHPTLLLAPPPAALDPHTLTPFVDPLPVPAIARAEGLRPDPVNPAQRLPYYRIALQTCMLRVHRDLAPTRMWGFAGAVPGPTFETRRGEGLLVEWVNALPEKHLLPVDHSIHGAEAELPEVRAVVHLHGAKAAPESDGYPEAWYPPGTSALCHYPNAQDAAMLWYHDHTLGINRLNVYAGLLGTFFIRDDDEDALSLPKGKHEIPLIVFDRMFGRDGQLYYPVSADPQSPWMPEFFGDAVLINGKLLPYLDVEPRKYRLRMLNAANARFFHFSISADVPFHQIGSDQGLLSAPVTLKYLSLAPGERADVIVDFSGLHGKRITLKNDIQDILQFRVGAHSGRDESVLPASLRPLVRTPESAAIRTRDLTLDEVDNLVGESATMMLNGTHWCMPITENPVLDTVEIWNLINLTDDAHPIHLHLVRFQILDRRRFAVDEYMTKKTVRHTGHAIAPEPGEAGWKDTVRADPGMITRIIVRFEGFAGRYVWHCHILEHEDNEMMRPFQVLPAPANA
ncbi:MAG: multicopper oxidase [Rudaea sp.]|nr:multicopper oxidase [Rudaea sp.]